ncbi:MAG: DUF1292 domain-containing protein [Tissierellia bacterium]|nr:DUF1292 domain-containing protein [Tissierellia bacterium]
MKEYNEHTQDHECCGGHHHEEDHDCCGGQGHHHHDHEEGHECCGGHGHDHDHDYEEEVDVLHLSLEDGTEMDCYVVGIFEFEGQDYIALDPVDEASSGEILLYAFKEAEGEEVELSFIEDEEKFNRVAKEFSDLFVYDEEE